MTYIIWFRLIFYWFWDLTEPWWDEHTLKHVRIYWQISAFAQFVEQRWKNEFQERHFSQAYRKPFKCGLHSTLKRDHIKKTFKPLKVFLTSNFKRVPSQNCTCRSCLLIIWSGMREIQLISPSAIQWSMLENMKLENYVGFLISLCQTNGLFIFHSMY